MNFIWDRQLGRSHSQVECCSLRFLGIWEVEEYSEGYLNREESHSQRGGQTDVFLSVHPSIQIYTLPSKGVLCAAAERP